MRGEDAAGFPTTCRMLVHPHMRGEQLRGPVRTIPTCVGPMCMNLTAPPCSAQPGTAVFPNFGDAALSPASSTSSAPLPCPGTVPCLDGIELRGSIPQGNSRVPQSHVVPHSPVGLTNPGKSTSNAPDAWALVLRTFTGVKPGRARDSEFRVIHPKNRRFTRRGETQAVTTKAPFCPVRPTAPVGETRRRRTDALKCA